MLTKPKIKTIFVLLFGLMLCAISSNAQSFTQNQNGITVNLSGSTLKVDVCTDNIIRVSYASGTTLPEKKSLVVINEWTETPFTVDETESQIELNTAKLKLQISKTTGAISYLNLTGSTIVSEDSKAVAPTAINGVNTFRCSATFNSPVDEALYGLGQHQGSVMNYKGKTQLLDQANMEIALPIIVSTKGYGIMWDNYARTNFSGNLSSKTKYKFESEAGEMVDYYFFYGPEIDQVIANYRITTGTAPMFPKWAFGLFQSMDKYESSADLLRVSNDYRKNHIPMDVIVQDWDYWTPNAWGSHKMNTEKYPDPKALIDSLHSMNVHSMISIWPIHTKGDSYYNEFEAIGANYTNAGTRVYYDPHNAEARTIYWRQLNESLFGKYGWDGWWADGCEPDNWPDGFDRKTFNTALGSGCIYYNTYPLMHTSSVAQGWKKDIQNKRLYTLSRSAFLGQQRNATACWSGDIKSDWTDFHKQLSAGLNFSLSGIPYWTTDIGGYWGTDWTTKSNRELFIRWFQYGTFCPIFRIHGKLERTLYSDASWDANTRNILLNYDKLRYRLMPYIYTLAGKVTHENQTVMRHLVMDYRTDPNVTEIYDQFLFGPSILVNPIATEGLTSRQVYLPAGKWFDFWTGESLDGGKTITAYAPLDKMPLYVKAGSIIPLGPEIEYAAQRIDPLELRIYKGANGNFTLYEDEGDNYNYENGQFSEIPFTYNDNTATLTIGKRTGSYPNMLETRIVKVVRVDIGYGTGINLPLSYDTIVTYTGNEMVINFRPTKNPTSHYEAENTKLSSSVSTSSTNKGFSGTGYVTGFEKATNAQVTFTVEVPRSTNYLIKLRYSAAEKTANRKLSLIVNGTIATTITCNPTADQNVWGEASALIYLNAGENSISYMGDSANVVLDCIDISAASEPVSLNIGTTKTTRLKLQNTELYLEIKEGKPALGSINWENNNQFWSIEKGNDQHYILKSKATDAVITVTNAAQTDNATVSLETNNSTTNQQWKIDNFGFGVLRITANHSGKCLSADGNNLIQLTDADLSTQRWVMEDIAITGNGNGLLGEYYSGDNFTTFNYRKIDEQINFNWGLNAPDAQLPVNHFSVRWTGKVQPKYPETYTFYTSSDDGVRLWINNKLIINDWNAHATTENSGTIALEANKQYDIKLEFFDNEYDAIVNLEWESTSQAREIIPTSQLFGTLPIENKVDKKTNGLGLKLFPNPNHSFLTIEYMMNNRTSVSIDLFNIEGKLMKSIASDSSSGLNRIGMNTSDLKPGIYPVRFTSGEAVVMEKLIME